MTAATPADPRPGADRPGPADDGVGDGIRTASLRRRVLVPTLAVVAVVITVFAVVVTSLLGSQLRGDLQERLRDRAGYAAVLQERGVTGQDLADELSGGGVFVAFASDGTDYVGRGGPAGPADPPRPGSDGGPGGPPQLPQPAVEPSVTIAEGDGLMTATVTLPGGTATLTATEDSVDSTLASLRTIQIVVGLVALLLTALALRQVVSASLRPLERMTAVARRIQAGARNRRLRPTHPHTELGRTAAAFDDMLDELESAETAAQTAEAAMRRFLADASHDLRTPLAGVVAAADALLRADPTTMSRADQEARLVAIVRQGRQAARLVDDLLTMARLDAESGATSPVPDRTPGRSADVAVVARAMIDDIALRRPEVRWGATGPQTATVAVEPDELRRILGNLLENAAAVSPPSGVVQVSWSVRPDLLALRVVDDGPGVAPADRQRIFDRFLRLSAARSGPGSGLGLPIARGLARRAGGDLVCRGRDDDRPGACFELVLPLAGRYVAEATEVAGPRPQATAVLRSAPTIPTAGQLVGRPSDG
ncbi:HAMP domain-containing histidine kinase [Nakamurella flava]|uniref:histidine kinase n=1 Tax=Nakamurella flava TaxID=2576308 RepID=A0A4U6QL23_9ACTN|nr:HAMP domain-containing sensor histidine kinase [Nakamurella flava]TKV61183.1 HAMP domain-containing histidine kinase [Nakamurella flava]